MPLEMHTESPPKRDRNRKAPEHETILFHQFHSCLIMDLNRRMSMEQPIRPDGFEARLLARPRDSFQARMDHYVQQSRKRSSEEAIEKNRLTCGSECNKRRGRSTQRDCFVSRDGLREQEARATFQNPDFTRSLGLSGSAPVHQRHHPPSGSFMHNVFGTNHSVLQSRTAVGADQGNTGQDTNACSCALPPDAESASAFPLIDEAIKTATPIGAGREQLQGTGETCGASSIRAKPPPDESVVFAPTTPASARLRRLLMTEHDGQDEFDDGLSMDHASQCIVWSSASRRVCRVSPFVYVNTPHITRSETEQTPYEKSGQSASPEGTENVRRRKSLDSERTPNALDLFSPRSRTLEVWRQLRSRRRSEGFDKMSETNGTSPGTPLAETIHQLGYRASRAVAALLGSAPGARELSKEDEVALADVASTDCSVVSHPPKSEPGDEAMLALFQSYEGRCIESDRRTTDFVGPREAASARLSVVSVATHHSSDGKTSQTLVVQPLSNNNLSEKAVDVEHKNPNSSPRFTVMLQDDWSALDIRPGDVIRLICCDAAGKYTPFEYFSMNNAAFGAQTNAFVVSAEQNLCIHHPDVLVSGTSVANAFSCQRRVVLGERNRYSIHQPRTTRAALRGTLLHELFQKLLLRYDPTTEASLVVTEEDLRSAVRRYYAELYALGESEESLVTCLREATSDLTTYVRALLSEGEGVRLNVRGCSAFPGAQQMRIHRLFDVEESVWSPVFGLKGSIDVTVSAELDRCDGVTHTVPVTCLELKTGHQEGYSGVAHRAQLILYALLLSERYRTSVPATFLLYMQCGQRAGAYPPESSPENSVSNALRMSFHLVPVPRPEIVGIVMARNKLAQYLRIPGVTADSDVEWLAQLGRTWLELPPPLLRQTNICSHCYVRDTCALLHRTVEQGQANSSAIPEVFETLTKPLTENHVQYYRHWLALTRLEEEAAFSNREEVWTMSPASRALLGRCIGDLMLVQVEKTVALGGGRFAECFRHRFRCLSSSPGRSSGVHPSVQETAHQPSVDSHEVAQTAERWDLLPGDYVSISPYWSCSVQSSLAQNTSFPDQVDDWDPRRQESVIAGGFVHRVRPLEHELEVDLERDCREWLERHPIPGCITESVRWRIDREELSAGFSTMYGNLEALLYPEAERLRRLVIDLEAPRFMEPSTTSTLVSTSSTCETERVPSTAEDKHGGALTRQQRIQTELNKEQQQAIQRMVQAQDYALLLGMPGTGKTATIACLIRLLVDQGHTVLLASHTHSAVDNVLRRLVQSNFHAFIRLGNRSHIEPTLWPYTLPTSAIDHSGLETTACAHVTSLDAFTAQIDRAALVATTCLGASHPIFYRRRKFDYVVVDEASQIAQPVVLGPLRFAQRAFILVGDDKQLPPLARHPQAQARGADESLFVRLCTAHPEAVTVLKRQYRMAADIMLLCNALVYQGALACGDEATAQQSLQLVPSTRCFAGLKQTWQHSVLDPTKRVLFLDTDAAQEVAVECRSGRESICNRFEASVVVRILQILEAAGIDRDRIGVTSPLRAQVSLLQSQFEQFELANQPRTPPECRTIDQFQGRDKDVIIVSLVRNNDGACIGQVLRDWRRLNVAMTRARCKLIFVGSSRTMQTSPFVERLIALIRDTLHGLVPVNTLD